MNIVQWRNKIKLIKPRERDWENDPYGIESASRVAIFKNDGTCGVCGRNTSEWPRADSHLLALLIQVIPYKDVVEVILRKLWEIEVSPFNKAQTDGQKNRCYYCIMCNSFYVLCTAEPHYDLNGNACDSNVIQFWYVINADEKDVTDDIHDLFFKAHKLSGDAVHKKLVNLVGFYSKYKVSEFGILRSLYLAEGKDDCFYFVGQCSNIGCGEVHAGSVFRI